MFTWIIFVFALESEGYFNLTNYSYRLIVVVVVGLVAIHVGKWLSLSVMCL